MDGVIIINKEKNMTSHDVVAKVRKILKTKKVGHAGTLDPLATGVLPILVGKATKLSDYLMDHTKTYVATVKLGEKTTTGDLEGEVIEKAEIPGITQDKVQTVLQSFLGESEQIPPAYSAIKVNGKKLYEYARQGETVEVTPRKIIIYEIELKSIEDNQITFEVQCSKGTYIRVLCEDIAVRLGTVGTMTALERTAVDNFKIKDATMLQDNLEQHIISIEKIFDDKQSIYLKDQELKALKNGVKLEMDLVDGYYKIYDKSSTFIGIAISVNGLLKRELLLQD